MDTLLLPQIKNVRDKYAHLFSAYAFGSSMSVNGALRKGGRARKNTCVDGEVYMPQLIDEVLIDCRA